jgi:hypothetical protein
MTRVIYRERIPRTDPRLGRHIHHDSESLRYPYRRTTDQLRSVRWPRRIPVLDQGNLGSCTGNAGIGCLGTDPFFLTVSVADQYHEFDEPDAVDLYSAATVADGYPGQYPPEDTGSDGLSVAKVLKAAGEIAGYRHALTLADALAALMVGPVITGVNWYEDMFNPDSEGLVSTTGALAGGHEFVVDEYDAAKNWVGCTNSWGSSWGLDGRFYLRAADWGSLLGKQGDVTVFVPAGQPAPTPTPPADPDHAFAAVLHPWVVKHHVADNHTVAKAGQAWLAAKGL